MREDVGDEGIYEDILERLGRRADAVISDMSPQVTGNWSMDHAVQISLNYSCARLMGHVLGRRGNALFKVFDGPYSGEFFAFLRKRFSRVKQTKPRASRKPSSELYVACMGYLR